MRRDRQWDEGRVNGIRWAVQWLHLRAAEMNDPHAVSILHAAAFAMGNDAALPKFILGTGTAQNHAPAPQNEDHP